MHSFMGWTRPIVTDSGGFQVFSMGHGTVADEIKGRAAHAARDQHGPRAGDRARSGVRFRSYRDGGERS